MTTEQAGSPPAQHAFEQADHALWLAGCGKDSLSRVELRAAMAAVDGLVEAARQLKKAYWCAMNAATDLANFCDESEPLRRCERELGMAEALFRASGIDDALIPFGDKQR